MRSLPQHLRGKQEPKGTEARGNSTTRVRHHAATHGGMDTIGPDDQIGRMDGVGQIHPTVHGVDTVDRGAVTDVHGGRIRAGLQRQSQQLLVHVHAVKRPVVRAGDAGDVLEVLQLDGVQGPAVFDLPDIVSTGVGAGKVEAEGVEDEDAVGGEGDGGAYFGREEGFFEDLGLVVRMGFMGEDLIGSTWTVCPARRSATAVLSPAIPAPTTMTSMVMRYSSDWVGEGCSIHARSWLV